jgi:hypothetical protein
MEYARMTEEHPTEEGQQGGLFANLPSARPGTRSPRRDAAKGTAKAAKAKRAASERKPAAASRAPKREAPPAQPRPQASRPPPASPEDRAETRGDAPGVEDLAWAGVTVAAEAATLGVRLLSRAVEAVRKPPDRR